MPDPSLTFLEKTVDGFLKEKHRPAISVLCYLLAGTIGIICFVSPVAPFSCNSEFVDSIIWHGNLEDTDFVVIFSMLSIILYLICTAIRSFVLHTVDVTMQNYKFIVLLFTIEDMFDLFAGASSLLFLCSVFLQMYHTGNVFISNLAVFIYLWTAYKFLAFFYARFANKNRKIINNAIFKFPG